MTREQAAKVARDLAYSLGARMYVVRRSSHDYLVLQQASADAAEIYDPTLTALGLAWLLHDRRGG